MPGTLPPKYLLKKRWEDYLRTPPEFRQVKGKRLDAFLYGVLSVQEMAENASGGPGLIQFSDMKSVSNILAGEFLVDMHHICQSSEDDDISQVQSYLLQGRGAVLLRVLHTLGVQGLSSGRELAELLMSLLPLCVKFPAKSEENSNDVDFESMEACFSHLPSWKPSSLSRFPNLIEVGPARHAGNLHPVSSLRPSLASRERRKSQGDSAGSDSNSDLEEVGKEAAGRSGRRSRAPLLASLSAMPVGVYPGLLTDPQTPDDDVELDEGAMASLPALSPLDLCLLMLNLICSLCHSDSIQVMPSHSLSFRLLPNLTQLLYGLHTDCNSAPDADIPVGWTLKNIAHLEQFIIRVIITLTSYATMQTNGLSKLIGSGLVTTLMTVARQALCNLREHPKGLLLLPVHALFKELQLAYDILYGLLLLMLSIFQNIPPNPSILNNALKLLHEVHSQQGLLLMRNILLHLENQFIKHEEHSPVSRFSKDALSCLVTCISQVMCSLKKAKIDYIHIMKCVKQKHRSCEYSQYLHHHHDILGISSASITEHHLMTSDSYGSLEVLTPDAAGLSSCSQQECVVAILGDFLLRIFRDATSKLLQVRTLCCVEEAGLCCCMVPNRIMRLLLQSLDEHSPGMRNYILCVLSRCLMDYCGGSSAIQKLSLCAVCREMMDYEGEDSRTPDTDDTPPTARSGHEFDSALSSSETSSQDDGMNKHPKWRCLRQFLPLIKHESEPLSIQVTQHLLHLVSQSGPVFKQELFYSVFLPLLQVMKEVYPAPSSQTFQGNLYKPISASLSDTVVQYCLSALPLLLHSQPAQNMFLNCGGLRQLNNLIRIGSFRCCVLKVFQVLIVMEDRQRQLQHLAQESRQRVEEWARASGVDEVANETIKDPEDIMEEHNQGWMSVIHAFIRIIFNDHSTDSAGGFGGPAIPPGSFVVPDEIGELEMTCDIWHTCAALFPLSHMFRQKFLECDGGRYAFSILQQSLSKVCSVTLNDLQPAPGGHEKTLSVFQGWLSLLESSLLICLCCCNLQVPLAQRDFDSQSLLKEMLHELRSSESLQGLALQAVCDMLLSCATTQRTMRDVIQNHIFAVMHLRIDDSDEAEVQELSDYCSTTKESETCHTEQGYEADSEYTADDFSKSGSLDENTVRRQGVRSATHLMLYPQLCHLVLDLLINHPWLPPPEGILCHVLLKLISLAKQSAYIASTLYDQGLVELLLKGLEKIITIKDPESTDVNKSVPVEHGRYAAEVRLILDLFLMIAQHTFSSKQLAQFLSLFQLSGTPVDLLLSVATSLAEYFKLQPTYIVGFPVVKALDDLELSVHSLSSDILFASWHPASRYPPLHLKDSKNGVFGSRGVAGTNGGQGGVNDKQGSSSSSSNDPLMKGCTSRSALSCASVQITLKDNAMWPACDCAFSVALWLRIEGTSEEAGLCVKRTRRAGKGSQFKHSSSYDNNNSHNAQDRKLPPRLKAAMKMNAFNRHWSESCLHLATLGSHHLQLEFWLDAEQASIIVRLVGSPRSREKILGEASLSHLLVGEKWQHLVLSYSEQHRSTRSAVTVVATVDGCYTKEVSFDYDRHQLLLGESSARDSDCVLAIGHAVIPNDCHGPIGNWQMGNLMLFRDGCLTVQSCFYLFTLGPDCLTIGQCDSSEKVPQYSHFLNQDVINNPGLSQDLFSGSPSRNMSVLQERLVMSFCPRTPNTYNLYTTQTASKLTQSSLITRLVRDSGRPGFNPLIQKSQNMAAKLMTELAPQEHHSLSAAINKIGGVGVFLFLFAKTIEQGNEEALQAKALKLLFTLMCQSAQHTQAFSSMGGYVMLAKTLTTSNCCVGYEMLRVLLDAALTRSVVRQDPVTKEYSLNTESVALLRNTNIVTDVILAWRIWDRADPKVWLLALQAIELLLRAEHPNRDFNFKQLHNINVVNKILNICLERIQEAAPSLPLPICESMVNIVRRMTGTPPDIHVVITICDFLLLTHPAASTYINHTPNQFYFMQKWGTPGHWTESLSTKSISSRVSSTPAKSLPDDEGHYVAPGMKRSHSMPGSPAKPSRRQLHLPASKVRDTQPSSPQETWKSQFMKKAELLSKSVDQLDNEGLPDIDLPEMQLGLERASLKGGFGWHSDGVFHSSDEDLQYDRKPSGASVEPRYNVGKCPSSGEEDSADIPKVGSVSGNLPDATPRNVNDLDMTPCLVGTIDKLNISTELHVDTSVPPLYDHPHYETLQTIEMDKKSEASTDKGLDVLQVLLGTSSNKISPASTSSWQLFPSTDSMKSISVSLTSTQDPDVVDENELGLVLICSGLIDLMCQVLVLLPEQDRRRIMGIILKPEVLLVMAHHNSPDIRTGTVRLLDVYFHCCVSGEENDFLQMQGFHLLSCQLHQHKATGPLVEACLTMVVGKPVSLDDEINVGLLQDMPKIQKMALVPLLSLLECCVHETSLCHKTLSFLIQMFEAVPDVVSVLLDNAVVETLCNVVSAINRSAPRFTDLGTDERSLLLEDVQHFFGVLTGKTFSTSGISYYQHLEDTFTLLYALEQREVEIYGINSNEVGNVRSIQCHAFYCIFDFISVRLETSQGYFFPLRKPFSDKVENWFSRNMSHYFHLINELEEREKNNNNLVKEETEAKGLLDDSEREGGFYLGDLTDRRGSSGSHVGWANLDQMSGPSNQSATAEMTSKSHAGMLRKLNRRHTFNDGDVGSERARLARAASVGEGLKSPDVEGVKERVTTGVLRKVKSYVERSPSNSSGLMGIKKAELSQSELLDRFKKVVTTAVDFVIFVAPRMTLATESEQRLSELVNCTQIEVIPFEKDFARFLLDMLLRCIVMGMERSFFQRKTLSNTLMWQAKDVLRTQFSRLFTLMIAPASSLAERLYTLDLLSNEPKIKDILKITVHIGGAGLKLVQYLYDLLTSSLSDISPAQRKQVNDLMDQLQSCGLMPLRLGTQLTESFRVSLIEDKKIWEAEASRDRNIWLKKKETAKHRLFHKLELVSKRISGLAMEVTQAVAHGQNQQRKKFVEHIKVEMTNRLATKKAWQQLIQQLTHERAVWHCPKSYPKSWQLDPTEGPCRVRRRLQRCHLGVADRFLKPQYMFKLDAEKFSPPLTFLFDEDAQTSDSAALIYRLHTNEKIEHTCRCISVTPSSETPGELLIGQTNIYFVGDEAILDANYTQVLLGNRDQLSMTLPQEDIKEVDKRWWQLKDNALEIFLTNGKTCLIAFTSTKERNNVYRLLESLDLPNLIHSENLEAISQLWLERGMTNFEYLTHLNKLSGRSFNDLMQYPVFPFILANYDSETLNINDPSSYRNLSKPISVQQKCREEKYVENYRWLQYEKEKAKERREDVDYRPDPYHYGSHYSNSGTVLHFLVRLPPFTQMFLCYQDNNFDLPDRTFHSMQTAWRLASFQSTTDVKELIPEFFFLPEFLTNTEGFNFGVRQTGEPVWDVQLPPWCQNNARLFVLAHRQALESDFVTAALPSWIDLVFGCKQSGRAAIEAINVFHPATYFGIDVDNIEDPVRRNAIKTMIKTYGQTPKQLFKSPHPMCSIDSAKPAKIGVASQASPLSTVQGLRWGNYLGAPGTPEPLQIWSQNHGSLVADLVALPTGEVFGLAPSSHLLVMYSKEKGVTAVNSTDILWAAILNWGHSDNVIRVTNRKNAPPVNFLHWNPEEQVSCCASVPDCRLLFFGGSSGVVSVISTKFNASKPSNLQVFGLRQCLYGHTGPIKAMHVCHSFSVLVTGSQDNTCIIWDLNRLSYVSSINEHQSAVVAVRVSDTLGDIASVSHSGKGSVLMLHTINAHHISTVDVPDDRILCVTFSHAAEGRSVNAVACGMNSGQVRMWSTWDLSPIRTIKNGTQPIISITFTQNNQRLYSSSADGTVVLWEKPRDKHGANRSKHINFIPFL